MTRPSEWIVYDCSGLYGTFRDKLKALAVAQYLAEFDDYVEVVSVTYTPVNFKEYKFNQDDDIEV